MQFVLQKEKQEAERKRVEAQGIVDYQQILSTSLSDKQLQYESILAQKEIAKSPNTKVIIMGKGNAPIILGNQWFSEQLRVNNYQVSINSWKLGII